MTRRPPPAGVHPHPSDWAPDYSLYPYNLWQNRVTPEMITAQRDSCQWFNAQYGPLHDQIYGFQGYLGDRHDVWTAPGVQGLADVVRANIDQSAAFLIRVRTPCTSSTTPIRASTPLYNGDSIYHLWYQLTQISDKMVKHQPSGVINANIATMNVYGNVIRDSGGVTGVTSLRRSQVWPGSADGMSRSGFRLRRRAPLSRSGPDSRRCCSGCPGRKRGTCRSNDGIRRADG